MTQTTHPFEIDSWLDEAFRGEVPTQVAELVERQSKFENVVVEMMTQIPEETRPFAEKLYEMHQADSALMYTIVAELFKRHLEDHPR